MHLKKHMQEIHTRDTCKHHIFDSNSFCKKASFAAAQHLDGGDEAVEDVTLGGAGSLVAAVPARAQEGADVGVEAAHAPEEGKEGGRGQVLAPGADRAQIRLRHHRQVQLRKHLRA